MIDEKKLIEERPRWLNPDCAGNEEYNKGWNACNKYWCNTIKAQPKVGEWIPCSERLPDESGTYIVNAIENNIIHVTFAKWMKRMKKWELTGSRSYWKVIAWQPLPEPYQPGKE